MARHQKARPAKRGRAHERAHVSVLQHLQFTGLCHAPPDSRHRSGNLRQQVGRARIPEDGQGKRSVDADSLDAVALQKETVGGDSGFAFVRSLAKRSVEGSLAGPHRARWSLNRELGAFASQREAFRQTYHAERKQDHARSLGQEAAAGGGARGRFQFYLQGALQRSRKPGLDRECGAPWTQCEYAQSKQNGRSHQAKRPGGLSNPVLEPEDRNSNRQDCGGHGGVCNPLHRPQISKRSQGRETESGDQTRGRDELNHVRGHGREEQGRKSDHYRNQNLFPQQSAQAGKKREAVDPEDHCLRSQKWNVYAGQNQDRLGQQQAGPAIRTSHPELPVARNRFGMDGPGNQEAPRNRHQYLQDLRESARGGVAACIRDDKQRRHREHAGDLISQVACVFPENVKRLLQHKTS